jgi:hypothetical protein
MLPCWVQINATQTNACSVHAALQKMSAQHSAAQRSAAQHSTAQQEGTGAARSHRIAHVKGVRHPVVVPHVAELLCMAGVAPAPPKQLLAAAGAAR